MVDWGEVMGACLLAGGFVDGDDRILGMDETYCMMLNTVNTTDKFMLYDLPQ